MVTSNASWVLRMVHIFFQIQTGKKKKVISPENFRVLPYWMQLMFSQHLVLLLPAAGTKAIMSRIKLNWLAPLLMLQACSRHAGEGSRSFSTSRSILGVDNSDTIQEGTDVKWTQQIPIPSSPRLDVSRVNPGKAKMMSKEGCWRGLDSAHLREGRCA